MSVINPALCVPDALALACVPEVAAREHHWLPFYCDQHSHKLYIACVRAPGRQLENQAIEHINQQLPPHSEWSIQWKPLPNRSELIEAINSAYEGTYNFEDIAKQCSELAACNDLNIDEDQWPVARCLDALINDAVHRRVSDIHLLLIENSVSVRYRVDGIMLDRLVLPVAMWRVLLSRLKVLSALDVTEHRRPQEGSFERCVHGRTQPIRSAFIPHASSEKITLRLLRSADSLPKLSDIFVLPSQHQLVINALEKRHGLTVVAGATGSGKTTTLYGCLMHWQRQGLNLITLEDPIEVLLPGLCQSAIHSAIGYSFSEGLKAALRHDPDGLLVGEIRDSETCALALRAAITGHPVLASVHANHTTGVFQRLMALGATLADIQQCVHTVIVQRLAKVPCVCVQASGKALEQCSRCYGLGYFGCVAAVEIFQPQAEFFSNPSLWTNQQAINDNEYQLTLQQLLSQQHIDQFEYDRLMNQSGGKDAQVSNTSG